MKRHASLNRIYRLVWSRVQNTWIAVSEISKGQGKSGRSAVMRRTAVATALSLAFSPMVHASPTGGQISAGSGTISQAGTTTTIQQSSQNLSLNWQSFNVTSSETVNFLQPSASAIAVNRIFDPNGSQILGHLNANGQVWLINPNGVLFGQGAQVNVGGLVASTLDVSNASLGGSTLSFSGTGTGSVINQGAITANNYVALLGNHVSNSGTITAQLGTVALGAGSAATLTFNGNSLLHLQVDNSTINNLAENGGLIQADGGQVIMSAGAKDALLASVVNNTGVIEARTVENHAGTITLLGGMQAGQVNVGGTLDASAPSGGNGGFIETSAAHVEVANDAQVTTAAAAGLTGSWLIDPIDFTIAATGGDITGATLSSNLAKNNVSLSSANGTHGGTLGNINVNDTVSWSKNTLTLTAVNDVNVNAVMSATGSASLDLEPGSGNVNVALGSSGFTGRVDFSGTGTLTINNNVYTVINSLGTANTTAINNLQGMNHYLSGYYALGSNIDATATSGWNKGAGFAPIGNNSDGTTTTQFTGVFDGLGHTISNLAINSSTADYVGLFGYAAAGSVIRNVGLVGGSVSGGAYNHIGGLVGASYGAISNSYATGSVSGANYVGGLVGHNYGTISNSYATGSVSGASYVGGLVGRNYGTIGNSYAAGSVAGGTKSINIGGLAGANYGTINSSNATGPVTGDSNVGGLAGINGNPSYVGTINTSYATGSVTGGSSVGGLVGINYGTVSASYAKTGSVSGASNVGGLVGTNDGSGGNYGIINSYAAGNVTGGTNSTNIGGLVGANYGTINASYATGSVTGGTGSTNVGGLAGTNGNPSFVGTISGSSYATGNVTGSSSVGGLVGANYGTISDSHAMGNVNGTGSGKSLGGLAGANYGSGTISNSFATGNVSGTDYGLGGLAGANYGTINNSYATGSVTGMGTAGPSNNSYDSFGGLVGHNTGTVSDSYAMGSVSGNLSVGGLLGYNSGSVSNSYATGSVTGGSSTGGLVGANYGSVSSSYATGSVTGGSDVGGLVGANYGSVSNVGTVSDSYATGSVTGSSNVGGLVGNNSGAVSNSLWDITTSGQTTSAGGMGMTTAQMQTQANFTSATTANGNANPGWDFTNTWVMYDGYTYPLLRSFMTPLTVTANSATKTYDGLAYNGNKGVSYSVTPNANLLGRPDYSKTGINAGSNTIVVSGLYSNQQGYIITFNPTGTLTVNPATLTATGTQVYNGTTSFAGSDLTITGVNGETFTASGSGTLSSRNVQSNQALSSVSGLALSAVNGDLLSNYLPLAAANTSVSVTPATLTATGTQVYNGAISFTGSNLTITGVNGETFTASGSGTLSSRNVQSNQALSSVSGLALSAVSGDSLSNYQPLAAANTSVSVTPALLAINAVSDTKIYDGTISSIGVVNVVGTLYGTDKVTGTTQAFASKNVMGADGSTLNVTGYTISDGNNGANYTVTTHPATGTITPASLTATGTQAYNGTASFAGSNLTITGVNGETFTASGSGALSSVNAQTKQPLSSVSGLTLSAVSGDSLSNYQPLAASNTSVTVIPLVLAGDTFIFPTGSTAPGSTLPVSVPAGTGQTTNQPTAHKAEMAVLAPIVPAANASSGWGGITVIDGGVLMPSDSLTP